MEILELETTIMEMKNISREFNTRPEQEEGIINKLEARSIRLDLSEEQKEKRIKKNEQSLRTKPNNSYWESHDKRERIFNEIMAKFFSNTKSANPGSSSKTMEVRRQWKIYSKC